MISFKEMKEKIEELGYYAEDELAYDAYNALCLFNDNMINPGQDIFAVCLEGPPGAGKTEFAKVYCKLANILFGGNVELVDYQCDATTGKSELFEDINISAAIRRDADHVNIPGKLVDAINKVKTGKKVVLFIDEYDKAREETDAFLLQFLQSGKINSTQHGDLEIPDKYKGNLQVILCKNDLREELSGPLSRRIRIIRLDYMRPEIFYKVATRTLIDEKKVPVNASLLNLVALIYQNVYASKESYRRLPSCSEMLIAIEDANRLLVRADAPQHVIYKLLIKNLFKSVDDINTFESKIHTSKDPDDKKLASLIDDMCKSDTVNTSDELSELITTRLFSEQNQILSRKIEELSSLISEYKEKFMLMEEDRKIAIDAEMERILLENGKLVNNERIETVPNFADETAFVKRGVDVFGSGLTDWIEIARLTLPKLSHEELIKKTILYASNLDVTIFENGIMIFNKDNERVIVVRDINGDYVFMSNLPVISSTTLKDIDNFIRFATQVLVNQYSKTPITEYGKYKIDALIYNDSELSYSKAKEHVYSFAIEDAIDPDSDRLSSTISSFQCNNHEEVVKVSKEIMNSNRKVLKDEQC